MSIVDDAISRLEQKINGLRRSEVTQILESLGFVVQNCRKGGHRKVKHTKLPGFHGSRFDGGHGTDDQLKSCYVRNMIKVLKTHKDELERLFGASQ